MRPTSFVSIPSSPGRGLLPEVRRIEADGRLHFCLPDVVAFLTRKPNGAGEWTRIRDNVLGNVDALQDCLANGIHAFPFPHPDGHSVLLDAAELPVVLRIAANINSPETPRLFERMADMVMGRLPGGSRRQALAERPSDWSALRYAVTNHYKAFSRECLRRGYRRNELGFLVNRLAVGSLGISVQEHLQTKRLGPDDRILDHCNEEELALRLVGFRLSTEIIVARQARTKREVDTAVTDAAAIIGRFRSEVESATLRRLISHRSRLIARTTQLRLPLF